MYWGTVHVGLLLNYVYVMSGRWTSSGKPYDLQTEPSSYIHFLINLQYRRRARYMTLTCTYVYWGTAHVGLLFSDVYVMSGRWTSSGKQYNLETEPSLYTHFLINRQLRRRVRHMTLTCIRSSAYKQQRTLDLLLYSVCRCRTVPANALLCTMTFMFIVEITYNFY